MILINQVQDIVVGTKSLTDVAKPSEIVSLFMDDEELAESVAKRKQAEAHGFIAPVINQSKKGLGELPIEGGDDEDDFFSLKKKVANGEDEDEPVPGPSGVATVGAEGKKGKSKRKAEGDRELHSFLFSFLFHNTACCHWG